MIQKDKRPVNLNLLTINLPIIGVASILHRISGFAIFLCFPLIVWLLKVSLDSENSFNQIRNFIQENLALKLLIILVAVGFIYHVLAGLKKILSEIFGFGETLSSGTTLAWSTFILSFVLSLTFLIYIW